MPQKSSANRHRFLDLTLEERTRYPDPSTKGPEERRYEMQENTSQVDGREGLLKLLFGRICSVMGLLLSTGGFVVATLGARRLGAASAVLGTAAVFFMAAASTGLIPGIEPLGHGYD